MYQVKFTTAYKKAYKLMKKRGLDISLLDEVIDLLRQGRQLEERYRFTFRPFQKIMDRQAISYLWSYLPVTYSANGFHESFHFNYFSL